jgi:hypothetical protein
MAKTRTEKEQRSIRRDQLVRLGNLMLDPVGRGYVYDLLASCHVFQSSFATNALAMAFNEGERNVGLLITNDLITASPDNYLLMLKEAGNVRPQPEPAEPVDAITDPDALIGPAIDS